MKRPSLCIHGHFYQPPRENPWSGRVEAQPSAAPAHDWNERITEECYRPNGEAHLLADEDRGLEDRDLDNYARMSFDFGPTLLAYLAREQRDVHETLVAADREACRRFGGHGSAIAQSYSHSILPLAGPRDRRTEVRWGLLDFELRFGRPSEGLWLPECAVDTATLETLGDEGLRFTILAPSQAAAVRRIGSEKWTPVGPAGIDTRMPYLVRLGAERSIAVYFYDGAVAHSVAFGETFSDGAAFLARLEREHGGEPGLVHFATDGETYGHHQRFGEMGLAWLLERVERGESRFDLTVYGQHLDRFPPTHEVEIVEKSSWSCAHGVERWRSFCGCSGGRRPQGNQSWRGPLRDALDLLRELLAPIYERGIDPILMDPWGARDRFAEVLVRRTPRIENIFLDREAGRALSEPERMRALQLLDMQRHTLLMYASCAWFFDDLSDIEALQAMAHAARAIELAGATETARLERHFRAALARGVGNDGASGDVIYDRVVGSARPRSD